MTEQHFDELLIAFLDRKPFHPFTVELFGGQRFEVDHPRATVLRNSVAVYLRPGGIPVYFDHNSVVQIVDDIADAHA
ncbi:MAG: hypothetical protein L0228_00850 [Planctomycetes bacterium]|nr:hypothetical protein [Planctomycetota bacterium]